MDQVKLPRRQGGMTMISWMLVIGIAVFFVVLGIKLIPTYIENYSVRMVLAAVAEDRQAKDWTPNQIRDSIIKRLKINGVYDFDRKAIHIKKEGHKVRIDVAYEVRKNMAGNIDAVMSFKEQVDL